VKGRRRHAKAINGRGNLLENRRACTSMFFRQLVGYWGGGPEGAEELGHIRVSGLGFPGGAP